MKKNKWMMNVVRSRLFWIGIAMAFMACTFEDNLTVEGKAGAEKSVSMVSLCTPDASKQATKVYGFLKKNWNKKTLSAAMANVNWNISEAEWVYQHTGKYPAMNCFDYIHLHSTPTALLDYRDIRVVEEWWKNNGLVSAMWHWNVPLEEGSKDYAFYAGSGIQKRKTSFDISKAVQEGTYENRIVKADLDKIADCLLLLKEKKIPVIWRPLHEASGAWFWWGTKGAEPFKALWKLMFQTFQEKGLNNLIWVWTSEGNDDEWFPGAAYVDIIGYDTYKKTNVELLNSFQNLTTKYPTRLVSLSECGNVPAFSTQWQSGAHWAWFMPWYDYARTKDPAAAVFTDSMHAYADKSWWTNAMEQHWVITRDQMPSLK